MTSPADVPAEVVGLADARAAAKGARDYAQADLLREQIAALGYLVTDAPDGYRLSVKPPFDVVPSMEALAEGPYAEGARCAVLLLVEGWPEDLDACVRAIVAHSDPSVVVVGLDCGNVDDAGLRLRALAEEFPDRVTDLHVAAPLAQVGWAGATTALIDGCRSAFVASMDPSTLLDGDAFSSILVEFDDPTVVASGWRGVDVDLSDNWRSFVDAGPGEVDAILGYLLVVRRDAATAAPPHPKARFYRNADMEWSLALRESGGRLVIPSGPVPAHQGRHHGYHDSDPEYRDRESRKTYDRLLQRFRAKPQILRPRG